MTLGLLTGPFLLWVGGDGVRTTFLGEGRLDALDIVAHAGLVLFLVGAGHELKAGSGIPRGRSLAWTSAGALVVPAVAGLAMAAWVIGAGADLRGTATTPSFVLVMMVALTGTAIPVPARILHESGRLDTPVSRLALSAAALIDLVAWAVLAVAITSASGSGDLLPVLGGLGLLVGATPVITAFGRLLRIERVRAAAEAHRRVTIVVIALPALGVAMSAKAVGINEILLAPAVGLALPADGKDGTWTPVATSVARGGRELVPVFFLVTGIGVFAAQVGSMPWAAIGVALALAVVGKVGGTFLGARLGGSTTRESLESGILLNTRGLTELVVLQAAFAAGIITPALYLALVVMTLVTTAMTGPLHSRLTREPSPVEMRKT